MIPPKTLSHKNIFTASAQHAATAHNPAVILGLVTPFILALHDKVLSSQDKNFMSIRFLPNISALKSIYEMTHGDFRKLSNLDQITHLVNISNLLERVNTDENFNKNEFLKYYKDKKLLEQMYSLVERTIDYHANTYALDVQTLYNRSFNPLTSVENYFSPREAATFILAYTDFLKNSYTAHFNDNLNEKRRSGIKGVFTKALREIGEPESLSMREVVKSFNSLKKFFAGKQVKINVHDDGSDKWERLKNLMSAAENFCSSYLPDPKTALKYRSASTGQEPQQKAQVIYLSRAHKSTPN